MIKILATALLLVCISFQSAAASPMNKNELIAHVAEAANLSLSDAAALVDAVLDGITEALSRGEEVRLVGFGTFSVVHRRATQGRNPRTGEPIRIPASNQPKFRAGKGLKEAVNKPESSSQGGTGEKSPSPERSGVSNLPDTTPDTRKDLVCSSIRQPSQRDSVMTVGTVKWFNPAKGFRLYRARRRFEGRFRPHLGHQARRLARPARRTARPIRAGYQ